MLRVTVCVGSSCFLKGSWQVVECLQQAIADHGLESAVDLAAGFCLGNCRQGVAVMVGDLAIAGVQPDQALDQVFYKHILPEVTKVERVARQAGEL